MLNFWQQGSKNYFVIAINSLQFSIGLYKNCAGIRIRYRCKFAIFVFIMFKFCCICIFITTPLNFFHSGIIVEIQQNEASRKGNTVHACLWIRASSIIWLTVHLLICIKKYTHFHYKSSDVFETQYSMAVTLMLNFYSVICWQST